MLLLLLSRFSHVRLCVTPETAAHQAPLSLGFSRQEYWSRLPCPLPGDLPHSGIKPVSHISCTGRQVYHYLHVCVRAHGRACVCVEREKKRECVCYPKAPGPRSPRGRQINLAAPPQGGRPPALGHRAAAAGCHNRPCHGPRAVRGAGKPAPTPTGEIDWASNPGPAARVPQSTRGGARQGRDATRLSSPTLPWAPQPLMPRGPGVPVPALW